MHTVASSSSSAGNSVEFFFQAFLVREVDLAKEFGVSTTLQSGVEMSVSPLKGKSIIQASFQVVRERHPHSTHTYKDTHTISQTNTHTHIFPRRL